MIKRKIKFLFFAIIPFWLGAATPQPHHTTAFIGKPGKVYVLPSFSNYQTNHFWNNNYRKLPTHNHFRKHSYLLYSEFAFNPCNSFTLNAGYSNVREFLNGNSHAFQDVELGWKHLLYQNCSQALTLKLSGIIPVGDKKTSIRYGRWGGEVDILYSASFRVFQRYAWVDSGIGYRYYHGHPSDQIRAGLALGYRMFSRATLIASSQLDYSVRNGKSSFNRNNVNFHPNYRLLNLQLECVFKVLPRVSISLGGFYHAWGQNVGSGGGFFCGSWLVF